MNLRSILICAASYSASSTQEIHYLCSAIPAIRHQFKVNSASPAKAVYAFADLVWDQYCDRLSSLPRRSTLERLTTICCGSIVGLHNLTYPGLMGQRIFYTFFATYRLDGWAVLSSPRCGAIQQINSGLISPTKGCGAVFGMIGIFLANRRV